MSLGLPPTSPARRHFTGNRCRRAGRLSAIAIASSVLAGSKDANAWGVFPKGAPGTGGPNCFRPGTLILTANGEAAVEDLTIGTLVMTTNGAMPIKWIGRKNFRRNASNSGIRALCRFGCHASQLMGKLRIETCIYRRNIAFLSIGVLIP